MRTNCGLDTKAVRRFAAAMVLLGGALVPSGCGHPNEIGAFRSQLSSATSDMTRAIDANPSAEGVAAARRDFANGLVGLHAQWNQLLQKRLTRQDKSNLADAIFESRQKLTDCFSSHTAEFKDKPEFWEALGFERTDFDSQFKIEDIGIK